MDADSVSGEPRSWANLPIEILSLIAVRLPLLELLSFRGTCKDFRSASSTATAEIESRTNPWLLFHKTDGSKCVIFSEGKSKTYNRKIPDLDGAIFLASYQGWLLLFKDESMFFFSPFSLSKITLPEFPHKQIDGHVAAFSDLPTSPHCIVSIINPIEFETNVISKGQKAWTQHKIPRNFDLKSTIFAATFERKSQTFYYMYGRGNILTFQVEDKEWKLYTIVHDTKRNKDIKVLPYTIHDQMFHSTIEEKMHQLDIEDDEYVDVCGLTYESENSDQKVYLNEAVAFQRRKDVDEAVNVSPTRTRKCKAVWIQPRFYEAHQDLQW